MHNPDIYIYITFDSPTYIQDHENNQHENLGCHCERQSQCRITHHRCPRVDLSLSICAPCTTIARDANNCATRNNQSHHNCSTSLSRSSLVGFCTRKRQGAG